MQTAQKFVSAVIRLDGSTLSFGFLLIALLLTLGTCIEACEVTTYLEQLECKVGNFRYYCDRDDKYKITHNLHAACRSEFNFQQLDGTVSIDCTESPPQCKKKFSDGVTELILTRELDESPPALDAVAELLKASFPCYYKAMNSENHPCSNPPYMECKAGQGAIITVLKALITGGGIKGVLKDLVEEIIENGAVINGVTYPYGFCVVCEGGFHHAGNQGSFTVHPADSCP